MKLNSIEDWLTQVYSVNPFKVEFGLERIKQVLHRFPVHQLSTPVITVTGTNGKGSTVAFLAHVLQKSGYNVGCFTSPHVINFNERIQINGQQVSDTALCDAFAEVESYRGDFNITFFEYSFLAALAIFQRADLDIVILEVGVGGLLDAVNCVDNDISVITSIALDHQQWLGQTREEIAANKAGIMRPGKPLVCGDPNPPVAIYSAAERLGSACYISGRDYFYSEEETTWQFKNDELAWDGLAQPHLPMANAATACQVLSVLRTQFPIMEWALRDGIKETRLIGRMQALPNGKGVMDIAHNPQSVAYLAERLSKQPVRGKRFAIFGMLADKAMQDSIMPMIDWVDEWHIAVLESERSASLDDMVQSLKTCGVQKINIHTDIGQAYQQLSQSAGADDYIVAFGSFFVVSAILKQ